jgi:hypothetical protein
VASCSNNTVVASINPKLLENFIDMVKIDADSDDDCIDEIVTEFLRSKQGRDASVTADFFKAEVLARVSLAMSEKDPVFRVIKAEEDLFCRSDQ